MTCEERIFSGIRTMNAIDERPAERKARADGDRRSRDAAWHRQHRGRKPRAIYEAESLSAEKPWVAEGISRASWYRRRSAQSSHNSSAGQDDITSAAFSDETGVSSLIYIDLRRCDDTPVSRSS